MPNEPAVEFAAARPDLVSLVRTSGGGHTGPWNAGPDADATKVSTFLSTLV